jgi:hypothetical protein
MKKSNPESPTIIKIRISNKLCWYHISSISTFEKTFLAPWVRRNRKNIRGKIAKYHTSMA